MMHGHIQDNFTIRQFSPSEVDMYKAIRLEALQTEPGVFGNSYDLESAFTDAQWLNRASGLGSAVFGLYCGNELAGLTGIVITDPGRPIEAYMTQSYIRKQYRGMGLSKLLYDARINWAKEQGVKRLIIWS